MRSARTFGVSIILLSTLAMAQIIPTIEQPVVPAAAQPGGAGFALTLNGAGFVPEPTAVLWGEGSNVTQLTITSFSATQLTATVPAGNIAAAGTSSVSVMNGIVVSNVEFFQIATPSSPLFLPPVDYNPLITNSGTVETTLAADFNGDGILDLAVGVTVNGVAQVAVLLGNSDGTFQSATDYTVDDASSIVAGRFTNDGGSIDLVAGDTLLKNNGAGVFTPTPLIVGFAGFRPFAVGDFSQTGTLNIAGLVGPNVQIMNNDGSSSFTLGQTFTGGTTVGGGLLTADFDGDGILDLAVLDTYAGFPAIRVFRGSLTGFGGGNPVVTDTPQGGVAFTAADFNGDNKQDIAFVYSPAAGGGQVLILNGNGDGTFTSGFSQALANPVTGAIVTADFNEDGKLDLATGTFILPGNGDGTFQTPISFGGTSDVLATGDFNGDGRPDLVAEASPNVAVLIQQTPSGAPAVMLSPSTLNFSPAQLVGTTSASQPVTLTNTGTATLTITSIGFTGANASEFGETDKCGPALAAGVSCTINVTFTPTAVGTAAASLSITDNAAGSPQTVALAGIGTPFLLSTTCTSLSVVPGQTAIYTVDLAPATGFNPTVLLSCSGAPALATCTVVSSVTLAGTGTIQTQVTATTTAATGYLQYPLEHSNGNRMAGLVGLAGIAGFAALVVLPGKRRGKPARRLCGLIFFLCLLATLATLPSCSGGVDPPGTAAGTYPLTVTGTFQIPGGPAITETVGFNLVVE
jgi:hypothetical protein